MRKNYKKKSRSLCGMCKDYKCGRSSRWRDRERAAQRRFARANTPGCYSDPEEMPSKSGGAFPRRDSVLSR